MVDAFFRPLGAGSYEATEHGRGPWSPDALHAGPPAALLATHLDAAGAISSGRATRVAVEILRPVPLGRLRVTTELVRPGGRVELVAGELSDDRGPIMVARAWRLRVDDLGAGSELPDDPPPPPPEDGYATPFELPYDVGYHTAMELLSVVGAAGFASLGPATAWLRPRVALVEDAPWTPLGRVLVAADSGNGVSAALPLDRFTFLNCDLVVTLHRLPAGDWVCLDARTVTQRDGIGLTSTRLADRTGYLGHALQSLLVAAR